jgi:hypothetical protein
VLLVRLLFCLFADDTGIFEKQSCRELIEQRTGEDGADLGARLAELFQVLNTEPARRQKNLDPQLAAFPYVNGAVFAEPLPIAQFDSAMRQALLDCCGLNWAAISPAIFGAMFQSVMDARARRNLGAHYTSEANILKLIKPLFLDELRAEFERVNGNRRTGRPRPSRSMRASARWNSPRKAVWPCCDTLTSSAACSTNSDTPLVRKTRSSSGRSAPSCRLT